MGTNEAQFDSRTAHADEHRDGRAVRVFDYAQGSNGHGCYQNSGLLIPAPVLRRKVQSAVEDSLSNGQFIRLS
jgi:hypothetical protein